MIHFTLRVMGNVKCENARHVQNSFEFASNFTPSLCLLLEM